MKSSEQIISLDLIDYLMDNTSISFHSQIGSKDFLAKLISLLKSRDSPQTQVKILGLIKKWGLKFESNSDILPNFKAIYQNLLNSGLSFPEDFKSEYHKYTKTTSLSNTNRNTGNLNDNFQDFSNEEHEANIRKRSSYPSVPIKLQASQYKKKYQKFVIEMNIVIDNIQLANQIIDAMTPGEEVEESLRSIMLNLKNCENGLLKAIQTQISDELLMSNCLMLNDDLNQTSERYNFIKSGKTPKSFISAFAWTTFEPQRQKSSEYSVSVQKKVSQSKIQSVKAPSDDIFGLFDGMTVESSNKAFGNSNTNKVESGYDMFGDNVSNANSNKIDVMDLIGNISNHVESKKPEPNLFDFALQLPSSIYGPFNLEYEIQDFWFKVDNSKKLFNHV